MYKKQNWVVKLHLSSLLARVKMVREAGFLRIPQAETLRLEMQLKKIEEEVERYTAEVAREREEQEKRTKKISLFLCGA